MLKIKLFRRCEGASILSFFFNKVTQLYSLRQTRLFKMNHPILCTCLSRSADLMLCEYPYFDGLFEIQYTTIIINLIGAEQLAETI